MPFSAWVHKFTQVNYASLLLFAEHEKYTVFPFSPSYNAFLRSFASFSFFVFFALSRKRNDLRSVKFIKCDAHDDIGEASGTEKKIWSVFWVVCLSFGGKCRHEKILTHLVASRDIANADRHKGAHQDSYTCDADLL